MREEAADCFVQKWPRHERMIRRTARGLVAFECVVADRRRRKMGPLFMLIMWVNQSRGVRDF